MLKVPINRKRNSLWVKFYRSLDKTYRSLNKFTNMLHNLILLILCFFYSDLTFLRSSTLVLIQQNSTILKYCFCDEIFEM